jgi:plasmid maintenance system antidote protein VapI
MTSAVQHFPYTPDSPAPPGESLKEHLDVEGVSQADLSRRTGLSTKHINQIVQGVAVLSPDTAVLLERATGVPATAWSQLEANWQTYRSRLLDQEKLNDQVSWVANFPLEFLRRAGEIPHSQIDVGNLKRILSFFGVANPEVARQAWREYRTAFRRSALVDGDEYAVATWLRLCERRARDKQCLPYSREELLKLLPHMRSMTLNSPEIWLDELPKMCAQAGVALVFMPALKNTHVSGATRWLTPNKAMIALSDRFKTDDTFWFSFFHEIGHVILHGKRLTFLDDKESDEPNGDGIVSSPGPVLLHGDSTGESIASKAELEADEFAGNLLIPTKQLGEFVQFKKSLTVSDVQYFSREIGVAPGIILGRLQHDGVIPWSHGRSLKRAVRFNEG